MAEAGNALSVGEVGDQLVVLPTEVLRELAEVQVALAESQSWGELKAAVSEERWSQIISQVTDEGQDPAPDLEDEVGEIPGHADGDWPEWPAQLMLAWAPERLRSQVGTVEESVLNGTFLHIPVDAEASLRSILENLGYTVERDDGLVQRASGFG